MSAILFLALHQARRIIGEYNMKTNTQEPEKIDRDRHLDVHSVFHTIQGEGPFCGHPAVFVRLAGCNLQCPGCDTEYTKGRHRMMHHQILDEIRKKHGDAKTKLIVITGGEPFRQPAVVEFINYLIDMKGYKVQIETNGTMRIPLELHPEAVVVCSPKAAKLHPSAAARANAFKYVLQAGNILEEDGLPLQALMHRATPHIARPPAHYRGIIYLQPMDEQDKKLNRDNIKAVVASCQRHGYVVQLQVHKYLEVE